MHLLKRKYSLTKVEVCGLIPLDFYLSLVCCDCLKTEKLSGFGKPVCKNKREFCKRHLWCHLKSC